MSFSSSSGSKDSSKSSWRWSDCLTLLLRSIAFILIIGCAFVVVWLAFHRHQFNQGLDFVKEAGLWGNLIMIGLFVVQAFPVSAGYTLLAILCGFLYGIPLGTATIMVGSTIIGAPLAFLMFRTLGKDWMEQKVAKNKKAGAVLKIARKNSLKIVLISRLTPIPFGLQNALFAVSGIPWTHFMFGTIFGMLPEAVVWAYLGTTARRLSDVVHGKSSSSQKVIFGVQVVAAVLLVVLLVVIGRRALKRAMEKEEAASEGADPLLEEGRRRSDSFGDLQQRRSTDEKRIDVLVT